MQTDHPVHSDKWTVGAQGEFDKTDNWIQKLNKILSGSRRWSGWVKNVWLRHCWSDRCRVKKIEASLARHGWMNSQICEKWVYLSWVTHGSIREKNMVCYVNRDLDAKCRTNFPWNPKLWTKVINRHAKICYTRLGRVLTSDWRWRGHTR